MANPEHLEKLKQGVEVWNVWRVGNPEIKPGLSNADLWEENLVGANLKDADLSDTDLEGARLIGAELEGASLRGANLKDADLSNTYLSDTNFDNVRLCGSSLCGVFISGNNLHGLDLEGADLSSAKLWRTDLSGANLERANLWGAYLEEAKLTESNLRWANLQAANLERADLERSKLTESNLRWANLQAANLQGADLCGANLHGANLQAANLQGADLCGANLHEANLQAANLQGANLEHASLFETILRGANLNECRVFGISAWDVKTDGETKQERLIIAREGLNITVGSLEIAQFLYLVVDNEKLGHFIRVMRTSAVLILGSFSPDSKEILEALRVSLLAKGFVPIVSDFDTSKTSYPMETVQTLALLSNFVIVDLSEPAGQYAEIERLVPTTIVPFIKIARDGAHVSGMLEYPHHWVIDDCIPYPKAIEEAKKSIPELIENQVLPRAEEMNRRLHPES